MNFPNMEELYTLPSREGYAAREALRTWSEHTTNRDLARKVIEMVNVATLATFNARDTGEHAAVRGEE